MKKIIFLIFLLSNLNINAQTDACLPARALHWKAIPGSSDEFDYYNYFVSHNNGQIPTQKQVTDLMCGKWYFIESKGNPADFNNFRIPLSQVYIPEDGSNVYCNANGICSLKVEQNSGSYYFPCDGGQQGNNNFCVSCYNWPNPQPAAQGGNGYPWHNQVAFNYVGAELVSGQPFTYGKYFEVKFRLPNFSNPSMMKGIQESFWFFPDYNSKPNCPANCNCPEYQEFDIFEVDHRYNNYKFRPTIHINNQQTASTSQDNIWHNIGNDHAPWGNNPKRCTPHAGPFSYDIDFSNGGFHTVGFEWQFENMNIYVDGHIQTSMNLGEQLAFFGNKNNMARMNMILSVGGSGFTEDIDNNTVLPHVMEIDYVHVFELNYMANALNHCSFNPNQFPTLVKYVPSHITLGGGNCSWLVPPSTFTYPNMIGTFNSFVIRATDYIELDEGFETDANSVEVYMDVSKLPL